MLIGILEELEYWKISVPRVTFLSEASLSLQLPFHERRLSDAGFLTDGLADVHPLVLKHLQGELYGSVLGLGDSAVGELSDELRLRPEPWPAYEVEGAVEMLLSQSHCPEAGQR